MKKFARAVLGLTVAGILFLPTASSAQDCVEYPLCTEGGTVSDSTPRRGQQITFSYFGEEGQPGASFNVDFLSHVTRLGTFRFDSNGNFSVRVTIPRDAHPGPHTLRAVGPSRFGGQLTVTAAVFVTGDAPLTPTGSNTLPWLLVGLGTVAVGGTFVGLARKRTAPVTA